MIESNQKAVDQLNKMKNVETLTSAKLFVGNNQIRLKSTGHVAALIMRYKGHFKGISRSMPNNSRIIRTEKEIIYIKPAPDESMPEELLIYTGHLVIEQAVALDFRFNKVSAAIKEIKPISFDTPNSSVDSDIGTTFDKSTEPIGEKIGGVTKIDNILGISESIDKYVQKRTITMQEGILLANQYHSGKYMYNANGQPFIGSYCRTDRGVVSKGRYLRKMPNMDQNVASIESHIRANTLYLKRPNHKGLFKADSEGIKQYIKSKLPIKKKGNTFKIQNAQSNYESKIVSYKRKNNKDAAIPKHPLDKDNKKSGNQSDSGIDRLVGLATTGDTYGGGGGA